NRLVYRIAGDAIPTAAGAQPRPNQRAEVAYVSDNSDAAWKLAQSQVPSWRTMTRRFAASARAPVVISVDEGYGGQPQKRTTFTIDRASGAITKAETFGELGAGRRLRSWLRFAHTGE